MMIDPPFLTRADLAAGLSQLGLRPGDTVMVHAGISRIGPVLGGPDSVIAAILDAVGPRGSVMAYTDWDASYEALLDGEGRVPDEVRPHVPPYDPERSRACRDNGILPEFLRTWPGARRSANSGASVAALGASADWLTDGHILNYGYGEASPFAKLVEVNGKVLMLGAPLDTMTLLHHAEHLAKIPGKRVRRVEVPFAAPSGTRWEMIEEFDTSQPVVAGLPDDYFAEIVRYFLKEGEGSQGRVGEAASVLVDADAVVRFAIAWLERRCG